MLIGLCQRLASDMTHIGLCIPVHFISLIFILIVSVLSICALFPVYAAEATCKFKWICMQLRLHP